MQTMYQNVISSIVHTELICTKTQNLIIPSHNLMHGDFFYLRLSIFHSKKKEILQFVNEINTLNVKKIQQMEIKRK